MPKTANRETIAVDVDDVSADHAEAFIEFTNERFGTNLTVEDYHEGWPEIWDVDPDTMEEIATEFHTPERTLNYLRKEGAAEALGALSTKYSMVVVTARPKHLLDTTYQWLDRHLPDVFGDAHFVPIWLPGNKVTKADICRQISADYLIDDLPKHCNTAAEAGIKSLLFGDYAWNRHKDIHPDIVRVSNWLEVLEYFDGRS